MLLAGAACVGPRAPQAPGPAGGASGARPTTAPTTTPAAPAIGPVASDALAESLLVDVARVAPGVRVELRYASAFNFMGEPLPGYGASRALLRREAAESLAVVARALAAEGLALKVYDAYRPARATAAMVAWTRRVRREDLLRDGYIAERSRHNLGLAVDVTLVDAATGRERKMGTAYDTFSPAAHTANATGVAAANRQLLKRAMEARGWRNLPEEWWHFSFEGPEPLRFDLPIR